MKKPEPLLIDGEVFKIEDSQFDDLFSISGARMCLSPYEAQVVDWLVKAIRWMGLQK